MAYTEEQLRSFSIYQLRYIAHQVGVKAPTTKKSEELVNHIIAIQNGDEEPYFPKTKLGRPLKSNLVNNEDTAGAIISMDTCDGKGKIVFNNSNLIVNNGETSIIKGYVIETKEQEYYVISYDNPVMLERVAWIPAKFVDKRRLRNGHYVAVEVVNKNEKNLPMAVSIKEVEGQQYKGFYNEQFEYKKVSFDKDRYFSFSGGTVFYGDRVIFSGAKHDLLNYVLRLTNEVYNYCESVVLMGLNLTPDKVSQLRKVDNVEMFYSLFSDNYDTQYFTYKLAVDHAKRLAELGKRVILIVANIENLYDNLEMSEKDKNASLKSLYGLARNFEDAGSFTVIGTCSQEFYDNNKDFEDYIDLHIKQIDKQNFEVENLRLKRDGEPL